MGTNSEDKKKAILRQKGGIGGRLKTRRDGYNEIGEDGFWEISKTTSSIFLSLIRLMLKIF